jgi:hypothetical protein
MRRLPCIVISALLVACGAGERAASAPVAGAPTAPSPSSVASHASESPKPPERAHRLLVAATGCWFGGVWRDALQDEGVDRCGLVLEEAYGTVDKDRLERLRAVEAVEVEELSHQLARIARADSVDAVRVDSLVALLNAEARAQHETTMARRAGDKIKKDIAGNRDPGKRPDDERASTAPLTTSTALDALLRLDAGALSAESRAIALMCAMDRMQTAKDLPKHLKVYAVGGAYESIFGVKPPEVPSDATQPMRAGVWLAYLSDVARAAGHPVPAKATSLVDRELMAWGGVLEGFSDKLRVEAASVSNQTELRRVVESTTQRLDTEYRASEASILASSQL